MLLQEHLEAFMFMALERDLLYQLNPDKLTEQSKLLRKLLD